MWDILNFSNQVSPESVPDIYKLLSNPEVKELKFMYMTEDGDAEQASIDLSSPESVQELKWALEAVAAGQGIGYKH
jgi:hypothetical protein